MNWREFAKKLLLADGRITEHETAMVQRAILEDHKVDREEVELLVELKREATMVDPEFDAFLLRVLKSVVMADGVIRDAEARWLRRSCSRTTRWCAPRPNSSKTSAAKRSRLARSSSN